MARGDPSLDALEDLLRRCHRSELMPLAQRLRVDPRDKGLKDLSTEITARVRRYGSHFMQNAVLRRGAGPDYKVLLGEICRRWHIVPADDIERTELAVMEEWLHRRWTRITPAWRRRFWAQLGLEPPIPESEEDVQLVVRRSLTRTYASKIVATAAVPFLLMSPLTGCLALFYFLTRPKTGALLPIVFEITRLRQIVRHRVTVGVVGSPSSGKDAAIKAIFGIDTGNVNPIAGSTKEVSITQLPDASALFVINTPGMGDVVQSVTEEAKQILHQIDVYVYVVNAQGGVQARELADYRECQRSGRPVLAVINKIDTLRESDRERYLVDARGKLRAPEEDFLAAAFDPLPQLSEAPIGLDAVREWIVDHLVQLGKDATELPWVAPEEELAAG